MTRTAKARGSRTPAANRVGSPESAPPHTPGSWSLAPSCANCEVKPAKRFPGVSLGTPDERFFCSLRCAADWALQRVAANSEWCGKRHEDAPNSGSEGPHGWFDLTDWPNGCPECDAETDEREAAS